MWTLLPALILSSPALSERVDRVMSVVFVDRIITESEVAFEQALSAYDVSPVPVFNDATRDPLERVEDFRILRAMAGDVALFQPSPEALDARIAAFAAAFESRREFAGFLNQWGLDGRALREQLYARMVVERYVMRSVGATLGPDATLEQWTPRYDEWIARQRRAAGVRRIPALPQVNE